MIQIGYAFLPDADIAMLIKRGACLLVKRKDGKLYEKKYSSTDKLYHAFDQACHGKEPLWQPVKQTYTIKIPNMSP